MQLSVRVSVCVWMRERESAIKGEKVNSKAEYPLIRA